MICPNCKKELADNANTCPECGYSFIEQKLGKNFLGGCGCFIVIFIILFIIMWNVLQKGLKMEFLEKIEQLKERAIGLKDSLQTEEATKNALVMPFLNALGYDVFNPLEVVPEFIADSRLKKDEKVDYAVMKDGKPIILIECKKVDNDKLDVKKQ